MRLGATACLVAAVAAAAGCGSDRATRGEGTVTVVATTGPVADIVRNAGGARVEVTALVPPATYPHGWRPDGRDLAALRDADLVVRAGGGFDAWAESGAERVLALLPRIDPLGTDPHWWHDPVRVQSAAKEIRNELARVDVDGAGYYEAATADFLERLRRLHEDIAICLSLVEPPLPRLAAWHDGFAYFDDRYGTRITAAGRNGGDSGVTRLWSDALAKPPEPAATYLGAMAVNTAEIVTALSRGEETCRPRP
ncbi:MAG TPA: metal ABC transporter substrate-binding protein [Thermoleophilaceae bacterium]|nr:metal ABC transporter substrate-binding protein [Thermoleophilaceae bacterium]